eukprot:6419886-Ditylum_brightwellii.AAC.1
MPNFGAVQPIVPPRLTTLYFTQQQMSNHIILGTGCAHISAILCHSAESFIPLAMIKQKINPMIIMLQDISWDTHKH